MSKRQRETPAAILLGFIVFALVFYAAVGLFALELRYAHR